jgi:hypothetical protein
MSKLKELLLQIAEKDAETRINPEDADPRVRQGVEAIKRNAEIQVGEIKNQYKDIVIGHAVIIAVQGPGSAKFAELATKKVKVQALDYKLISQQITQNLLARGHTGPYNQNAHMMLWDEMNRARIKYGFIRLPQPQAHYTDGVFDATVDYALDFIFEKNYGSSLYSSVTRREIGELALKNRFDGEKLPVVLYNYTGAFDPMFLPAPVLTVTAEEDVTERFVKSTLNEVRLIVTGKKEEVQETLINE